LENTAVAIFRVSMQWLGVLEALYRAGSMWQIGFDDADWWSRRVSCYSIGDEPVVEEKR
jgi:hypothetical protein